MSVPQRIPGALSATLPLPEGCPSERSRRTPARPTTNSRLSRVVSIFPVIGYASVTEDKLDQFGEACFGANVVRENQDATLTGLDADHGVGGLAVVAAFVKAVALRAAEERDAQPRVQILALLSWRQIAEEEGEQTGSGYMQYRSCDFGA